MTLAHSNFQVKMCLLIPGFVRHRDEFVLRVRWQLRAAARRSRHACLGLGLAAPHVDQDVVLRGDLVQCLCRGQITFII